MVGIIPMADETEWQRIRRVSPYIQASLAACGLYWRGANDCWTISEANRQRLIGYLEQRDAYERARLPMADPPPRSNYEHATYGDG